MGNVPQLAFNFTPSVGLNLERRPYESSHAFILVTQSYKSQLDGVPFLELGKGWALSADRKQWILNKAKNWRGTIKWQPVSFVGSDKAVLMRVMKEKGLQVPTDASATVNRFFAVGGESFLEWREAAEVSQRRSSTCVELSGQRLKLPTPR